MGRVNMLTKGVFTEVYSGDKSKTEDFIKIQDELNPPSPKLDELLKTYKHLQKTSEYEVKAMALAEELIMQMRIEENFKPEDIKFNMVRNYIYARVPFPKYKTKKVRDIRTIVGLVSDWGKSPWKNKSKKEKFLTEATIKIKEAMLTTINQNIVTSNEFIPG